MAGEEAAAGFVGGAENHVLEDGEASRQTAERSVTASDEETPVEKLRTDLDRPTAFSGPGEMLTTKYRTFPSRAA